MITVCIALALIAGQSLGIFYLKLNQYRREKGWKQN